MAISAAGIRAASAFVEVGLRTLPFDRGLRGIENKLRRFGSEMSMLGTKLATAGVVSLIPVGLGVREFAQYDNQIKALQGIAAKGARSIDFLSSRFKELGRTTSFTAVEIATAAKSLAKGGFDTDLIDSSIEGVLNLARATETELPRSAEMISKLLNAFQVPKDLVSITKFVDQLVLTVNRSPQGLEDLFESVKNFAPQGKALGQSTESLLAFNAALAKVGLTGTLSGTQIRRIFVNLANVEKKAKLLDLGVDVDAIFRGGGDTLDVLKQLEAKFSNLDMGALEESGILNEIFEVRGQLAAKVFLKDLSKLTRQSGAGLQRFIKDLKDVDGFAKQVSTTIDQGLGNQFKLLVSALSGVGLAIGESLKEPLVEIIGFISDNLNVVSNWVKSNTDLIRTYTLVASAVTAAGIAMFLVGGVAFTAAAAIGSVALAGSLMVAPIIALVKGFGLLVSWVGIATNQIGRFSVIAGRAMGTFASKSSSLMGSTFSSLISIVSKTAVVFGTLLDFMVVKIVRGVVRSYKAYEFLARALILVTGDVLSLASAFDVLVKRFSIGIINPKAWVLTNAAIKRFNIAVLHLIDDMELITMWTSNGFVKFGRGFITESKNIGKALQTFIMSGFTRIGEVLKSVGATLKTAFKGFSLGRVLTSVLSVGAGILKWDLVIKTVTLAWGGLMNVINDFGTAFEGIGQRASEVGAAIVKAFSSGQYIEVFNLIWLAASDVFVRIQGAFEVLYARSVGTFNDIKDQVVGVFNIIKDAVQPLLDAVVGGFVWLATTISSMFGFDLNASFAKAAGDADAFFDSFLGKLTVAANELKKFGTTVGSTFEKAGINLKYGYQTFDKKGAMAAARRDLANPENKARQKLESRTKTLMGIDRTQSIEDISQGPLLNMIKGLGGKTNSSFTPEKIQKAIAEKGGIDEYLKFMYEITEKSFENAVVTRAGALEGSYIASFEKKQVDLKAGRIKERQDQSVYSASDAYIQSQKENAARIASAQEAAAKRIVDSGKALKTASDQVDFNLLMRQVSTVAGELGSKLGDPFRKQLNALAGGDVYKFGQQVTEKFSKKSVRESIGKTLSSGFTAFLQNPLDAIVGGSAAGTAPPLGLANALGAGTLGGLKTGASIVPPAAVEAASSKLLDTIVGAKGFNASGIAQASRGGTFLPVQEQIKEAAKDTAVNTKETVTILGYLKTMLGVG